jgi:hypothetical protein
LIHLVGRRSGNKLEVYDRGHALAFVYAIGTDAWGNHDGQGDPPWGHDCWMPVGHYVLGPVEFFDAPIVAEGFGQIPINDFSANDISQLANAGRATFTGMSANIGGIDAPFGQLTEYNRSAMFVHGGGTNSPDPLADNQGLYRTLGCTRMLNADWKAFATWLDPQSSANIVVYTALETPADLGG